MTLDSILKFVLPIIVLMAFALVIYSGFKKQSIKETWEELLGKLKGE